MERKLRAGDCLPNEQELSKHLGVSRGSVREAMKILSAYGLVDVKVGDGTYIASSLRSGMIESTLYSFLLSDSDYRELAEFRKYIELDIVRLIIAHKKENEDTIVALKENVAQILELKKKKAPMDAFVENDLEFHRLLGKACCNYLIESVYKFIMDFQQYSIISIHKSKDHGEKSYKSHSWIISAIEKQDLATAKSAIDYTMDRWQELLIKQRTPAAAHSVQDGLPNRRA